MNPTVVWAHRDYYVKPLILEEIEQLLLEMQTLRQAQNSNSRERVVVDKLPRTPVETRFLPPISVSHLAVATNYVKKHLDERISVSAVATLSGLSTRHFSRRFLQEIKIEHDSLRPDRMDDGAIDMVIPGGNHQH